MKLFTLLILLSFNTYALNPGDKAPDFNLIDQNGKNFKLSSLKNQFVVLEWFNHGCPYVKKHYGSNHMQTIQALYGHSDLVTWVTILSSAKGKQGYLGSDEEVISKMNELGIKSKYFLRDTDGKVGQLYGAKTTPHMYIIDAKMKLRYVGAIDSVVSTNTSDIKGATNYVTSALSKLMLNEEPSPAKTKPYGCSVKY